MSLFNESWGLKIDVQRLRSIGMVLKFWSTVGLPPRTICNLASSVWYVLHFFQYSKRCYTQFLLYILFYTDV